jgi:hypothetical protein
MKFRLVLTAAAVTAVAVVGAGSASAIVASPSLKLAGGNDSSNGADNGIHDSRGSDVRHCDSSTGDSRTVTYTGPISIWPPNHKLRDYSIVAHDDGGTMTSLSTVVSSDEPANAPGSGNTPTDTYDTTPAGADEGTDTAENDGQVRGERSGQGDGRTYTFTSTATWSDGSMCTETFTATVPHDQSGHNGKSSRRARHARRAS